jgi:hypothetical protein
MADEEVLPRGFFAPLVLFIDQREEREESKKKDT